MKKKLIWTRPVVITCSHCFSSFVCQQVSSGKKLGPVVSFCKLGLLCYLFWIFLFVCAGERWGRVTLLGEGDWTAWLSSARDQWKNHQPLIDWDESHRSSVAEVSQKWKLFQNELVFFLAFIEVLYYRQWKFRPTFPNFPPGAELA